MWLYLNKRLALAVFPNRPPKIGFKALVRVAIMTEYKRFNDSG